MLCADLLPQEEVASFYAVMIKTDYMDKPTFQKNFWEGFRQVLGRFPGHCCDTVVTWSTVVTLLPISMPSQLIMHHYSTGARLASWTLL